jgi:phage head maturation protease
MAQIKRDTKVVNTKIDSTKQEKLSKALVIWGYSYQRQGTSAPWWGAFIEAIADGIIADDGENVIFKIPYKKG